MDASVIANHLKDLLLPIISDKQQLTVDVKTDDKGYHTLIVNVSSSDIRKVIGNGGRNYRSLKTILKCSIGDLFSDLIVNVVK
jgi:predicted RNA-binding protein YlqC (UPF0109 family)